MCILYLLKQTFMRTDLEFSELISLKRKFHNYNQPSMIGHGENIHYSNVVIMNIEITNPNKSTLKRNEFLLYEHMYKIILVLKATMAILI